jgi:hypothetical protein
MSVSGQEENSAELVVLEWWVVDLLPIYADDSSIRLFSV